MSAGVMLAALLVDAAVGWPAPLYRRIGHPVTWLGHIVSSADSRLNRPAWLHAARYAAGAVVTSSLVLLVYACTAWTVSALPSGWFGTAIQVALAAPLLASRSLHQHVAAVHVPLNRGDLPTARAAVSQIVGRDPEALDEASIARAAIESLAENLSDGVVAPLFWGVLLGLPGLASYKVVNTLDSMIGHRTARHAAFGGFAARLDDLVNLVPARVSGMLIVVAAPSLQAFRVMTRDASRHRSPNAGWPESAMAGALGVRLSGPRVYGGTPTAEPWLNAAAPDPRTDDLARALRVYVRALVIVALLLAIMTLS